MSKDNTKKRQVDLPDADELDEEAYKKLKHDRCETRIEYKNTKYDVCANKRDMQDVDADKFQEVLTRVNRLENKIYHGREQQLDADLFRIMSTNVNTQANSISDTSRRFDKKDLLESLRRKFSDGEGFSWQSLGYASGSIFSCAASTSTMVGPLSKEIKVRKVHQSSAREDLPLESPEDVLVSVEGEDDGAVEDGNNVRIQNLKKTILSLSNNSEKNEEFDLLELLVDPEDRIQTIENFFDFSFLVKNKFVSLKTKTESYDGNDFHKPIAVAAEASRFGEGSGSRQSVLTMTMRDIEEVADFFCCTKRSVRGKLHRDDELYAEMQPSKQSDLIASRHPKSRARSVSNKADKRSSVSKKGSIQSTPSNGSQHDFISPTTTASSRSSHQTSA